MKKVLVEAYLALNLGDDLFLKILFERYPNVNFEIINRNKKYKDVFGKYENVKVDDSVISKVKAKYFPKLLVNKYDAYVNIGGSIFIEYPKWREHYENRKSIISSFYKRKKPTFILGSNFGPYLHDNFKELYHSLFSKCTDICFREKHSYKLFNDLPNVRVNPDIIFGLDYKSKLKVMNSLGISLMDLSQKEELLKYESDYLYKIKDIIENALDRNICVNLFSFCEKQGDLEAIKKVLDLISHKDKSKIKIFNYDGNMEKYLEELASMELMIGTRFHACILAQVFNQGLYPIIYSQKTYNVLKDINLDEEYTFIQDIKTLDVDHLFSKIKNNKIKNTIIFDQANEQFKGIDKYV